MRGEEPNGEDLVKLALRGVGKAAEDLVGRVERLGDEAVGRNAVAVLAAELEVDARSTRAGGESERSGELDASTSVSMLRDEASGAKTYKSAAEMLCRARMGFWRATISSRPPFAWKPVSMFANVWIEPSAPPPLRHRSAL